MNLTSEIWTWQEGSHTVSRVTTNAPSAKFVAKLRALGLLDAVQEVHAFFGDRRTGGTGYEIVWKQGAGIDELLKILPRL